MPTIDPDRLLGDLRALARIGAYKTGVHRPTFSAADMEARRWLMTRLGEAGLEARIDGIGSVFGLSHAAGPTILTGSHLESQNQAGWLDGALGVIYGLEAARAFRADPDFAGFGIDVAAWADEESHFAPYLGSRSYVGALEEAEIDAAVNRTDGTPLRQALDNAGLAGLPRERVQPGRHRAYVEAHIEQGGTLEETGRRIGIVTAIVGTRQMRIVVEGEQNHAGTTSMSRRRDAGLTLVRLLAQVDERFPELAGSRSVWTTGRITLEPGAPAIVPGRAEAIFQFRDADDAVLERLEDAFNGIVGEAGDACPVTIVVQGRSLPARMDDGLQQALEDAAEAQAPGSSMRMPSGAGHDAQYLARVMPAAMLFVPSIGGISHHWRENTSDADIVLGAQVFCDGLARMLKHDPGKGGTGFPPGSC